MATAQTYWGTSIFHESTGVTYHFAETVEYGYYWNGDPFVVSGGSDIVITKITPEDSAGGRVMHGAMLQPEDGVANGFDDAAGRYNSENNVDPAATGTNIVIDAASYPDGASLVKAVSLENLGLQRDRSEIDKFSVLTVVPSTPPEDAFRPPIAGSDKTSHYTLDDLDFSKLQSVAAVAGQDPITDFEYLKEATYVSWWSGNDPLRDFHPNSYHDGYNDYQLDGLVDAFMALHSDYTEAEKLDLYAAIVQQGLDYAGALQNGIRWPADGGHANLYKPFVVTAASALNSDELIALSGSGVFSEDTQFRYITAEDIGHEFFESVTNKDPKLVSYQDVHVGMPEWTLRAKADNRWDPELYASYRWINSDNVPALALTMEMLGNGEGREIWGNEAYFDYAERVRLMQSENSEVGGSHTAEDEWLAFVEAYHGIYSAGSNMQFRPEAPQKLSVSLDGGDIDVVVGGDVFAGGSPVTRVDIRYGTSEDDWTVIQDFGMSGTIAGLSGGDVYFVQARYVNAVGEGPWTDNRFETTNDALIDLLEAEGFITRAEMNAVGGQRDFQKTEIYKDHLRSILNGDEGYEDLADAYVSGTILVPTSEAAPEDGSEAEIEPEPIIYPVIPDSETAEPVTEPTEPPIGEAETPDAGPVNETEPGLDDGEVAPEDVIDLEDLVDSGTPAPSPAPEETDDGQEAEVIDPTLPDEPVTVDVGDGSGSYVEPPQDNGPGKSAGRAERAKENLVGSKKFTLEDLAQTLPPGTEGVEEVDDEAPVDDSSDGGDFSWVLAAALVVPLLLAFAR